MNSEQNSKNYDNEETDIYIDCIGVDNKRHICFPHSVLCKCGIPIKRKSIWKNDYKLFSCYECTY